MSYRIIPAIMSGGAGTRLWPASTEAAPKQFHALGGGADSMFVATLRRLSGGADALAFAPPIVLANAKHADLVDADLARADVSAAAIVLEPMARNTAAVGAIAAAAGAEIDPDALILLLPADHIIADAAAFHAAIARAAPLARDRIVTFGITPDRPATGYGYIKAGEKLAPGVFAIDSFREKPNLETARDYLAAGGYAWNAGMFLFSPRVMLEEFAAAADIRDAALTAFKAAKRDGARIELQREDFAKVRSTPLDIAVMEQTRRGAVAPCDIGWADVGAWDEIWRLSPHDAAGNALAGDVVLLDGANNLIRSDGPKICAAGVNDLIVVATAHAILILPRARAQDVKALKDLADGK
ncbi:MAG: mannose-1-phosphate guanylyltransferase [Hyphomonadaceae bacterium]